MHSPSDLSAYFFVPTPGSRRALRPHRAGDKRRKEVTSEGHVTIARARFEDISRLRVVASFVYIVLFYCSEGACVILRECMFIHLSTVLP